MNPMCSEETANKRMAICESCPKFLSSFKRCDICGCFMVIKTKLKDATCPDGLWGKENENSGN